MPIKNVMEDFVEGNMKDVLHMYPECCRCHACRDDIMSIALNHLEPKYVSTEKGGVFAKLVALDPMEKVVIIQEIAKAVQIVAKSPRHPEEEKILPDSTDVKKKK
ncbi:hypothetical protein TAMA11512_12310 [Selenomonas sp. TAMA-11512]|uniref:late competence development ComFB family protein n=1 Tax=Selenomonas sp. TAMA-11512 TaxID=3095337 RepID=UPI0030882D5B|nr:hypothetical protein TAMA11512_12310 [Selenomonas sp. TAMA-11512]